MKTEVKDYRWAAEAISIFSKIDFSKTSSSNHVLKAKLQCAESYFLTISGVEFQFWGHHFAFEWKIYVFAFIQSFFYNIRRNWKFRIQIFHFWFGRILSRTYETRRTKILLFSWNCTCRGHVEKRLLLDWSPFAGVKRCLIDLLIFAGVVPWKNCCRVDL